LSSKLTGHNPNSQFKAAYTSLKLQILVQSCALSSKLTGYKSNDLLRLSRDRDSSFRIATTESILKTICATNPAVLLQPNLLRFNGHRASSMWTHSIEGRIVSTCSSIPDSEDLMRNPHNPIAFTLIHVSNDLQYIGRVCKTNPKPLP
jgi:hypothetical protein